MQQQPAVGAIVHVSYISLFLFAHVVICKFVSFPPLCANLCLTRIDCIICTILTFPEL